MIPDKLKDKALRFIKIMDGTKRAIEKDWQMSYNYKYNEKEFQEYLKQANSYGVVCGYGNLAVIDCDDENVAGLIALKLPKTYTVKTGSGGRHFYFYIPDLDKKIIMNDDKGKHHGEVQFSGSYVLGANSIHPNGNKYEIAENVQIATITKADLMSVIGKFVKKKTINVVKSGFDLDISKVANNIGGLKPMNDGALQGTHPIHGSHTGGNFRIEPDKNIWNCFRCGTGGDTLYLIAMLEGLVECHQCGNKFFRDNKKVFKETLKIAREKYGYTEIKPDDINKQLDINNFLDDKGKFDFRPAEIADIIEENINFITVIDATGRKPHIYYYEDGYYKLNGDKKVEEILRDFLGNHWKTYYKNEILDFISSKNLVDREDLSRKTHLINLNNGVYDIRKNQLLPHSKDYYFLYKIPVNYNPKAKCPRTMKYFESTLEPEFIKLSQEIFGYCLYYDYPIAGIFYLYGLGGNGKSVWEDVLQNMLGRKNIATKELSSIANNRFTSSLLYGKLANICGELTNSVLKNTDTLKRLSAGDYIQAEFKGKDGFDFKNKAKIITSCNSIPHCTDMTYGWYQRQYIIPFLKKFRRTKKEDTHLIYKLTTKEETEGTLLWAIEGLKRILKNEEFSYPEDMIDNYLKYQKNITYFLENNYTKTNNAQDYIDVDEIRKDYIDWCKKNKVPVESENSLGRKLTYFDYPKDKIGESGKYTYIRRYIKKVK